MVKPGKIAAELQSPQALSSLTDELARLQNICTIDWLYQYYSPQGVWSEPAWLDPDLRELDF